MELFQTTASGTGTGPPRKWGPNGTEPKSSRVNTQDRSRQVCIETRQGEIRPTITRDAYARREKEQLPSSIGSRRDRNSTSY